MREQLIAILLLGCGVAVSTTPDIRDGDIVFHTSRSAQSVAIQRATGSKYSHIGIVFTRQGQPFVLEAVATVRFTPLEAWMRRGEGGRIVVKRLKDADRSLTPANIEKLRTVAAGFEGKSYDLAFGWSDERIYCSELVWKIYERALTIEIGRLEKLRDFRLDDPIVRAKLEERYGENVPLDETVVPPSAIFESALLETIAQR